MEYKKVGSLNASHLVLGTDKFGDELDIKESHKLLNLYTENGGNIIDTARSYSIWAGDFTAGQSERIIGAWLKKVSRTDVYIATKCSHPESTKRMDIPRLSEADITFDVEGSLKDLGTDYIDLLWLHRDDERVPVSGIMVALHKLVRQGKVLNIGASNWTAKRIKEANEFALDNNLTPFCASQIKWSLAKTASDINAVQATIEMDENEYSFYNQEKMPVFAFSSQAKGFFYKMEQGIDAVSGKAKERYFSEKNIQKYKKIKSYCEKNNISIQNAIISSLLSNTDFDTFALIGPRSESQLLSTIDGAKYKADYEFFKDLMF